jgi:hypothetical protein
MNWLFQLLRRDLFGDPVNTERIMRAEKGWRLVGPWWEVIDVRERRFDRYMEAKLAVTL